MTSYTITLKNEDDFRILKKILKAFDGASIVPAQAPKNHFEMAWEEANNGNVSGPFNSVDDLMKDLLD